MEWNGGGTCQVEVWQFWPTDCQTDRGPEQGGGPLLPSTVICLCWGRGGCAISHGTASRCGRSSAWRSTSTSSDRNGAPAEPPNRLPVIPSQQSDHSFHCHLLISNS